MVVFTCGACNESLKKNQVEKHYTQKCRRCEVLSCVDCGKDFWGEAYKEHIKCISEEEKYSGKNYTPRPGANKGEQKQEMWIQQVEKAINETRNSKLKGVLVKLKDYPNIPRKQKKFENFVRNSVRINDSNLIAEVWDVLMKEIKQEAAKVVENGHSHNNKKDEEATVTESGDCDTQQKTLNKRERKEERRKMAMKKQKKDKKKSQSEEVEEEKPIEDEKKKKKKRKHQEVEEEDEEETQSSKKKKKKPDESSEDLNCSHFSEETEDAEPKQKKQKFKFRWQETMVAVLKKKGEMSLKRMKKKIVDEYISQGGVASSEKELWAKFDKKVKKIPLFKVHKDRVKLVQ